MKKLVVVYGFSFLMICSSLYAMAEDEKPVVSFNGFVDTYYSLNFNSPKQVSAPNATSISAAALPAANNNFRYYDTYHNQMTLNLVEFSVQTKFKEVSLLADFDFGPFADLNASGTVVDEVSKHIGQAVLSYRPTDSRFFFEAGKMYSHMGLETVKSKDNFNYSRTILFGYGIPFWHTGVRFGYDVVPDKFQTSLYVYNGWNSIYDTNQAKTLGLQLKYSPSSQLSIVYNIISGAERANSEADLKTVHELNTNWNFSPTWTLGTDILYGSEENSPVGAEIKRTKWYGGLLNVKFQINEASFLSPRYEYYRDENGYTLSALPQTIQSLTLTYGRVLTRGLELRTEARLDKSNEKTFTGSIEPKDSQTTVLAALLFNF